MPPSPGKGEAPAKGGAPVKSGALAARIASALVLAPVPIAAIWFGSPWLPLLAIAAAGVLGWEWARLCGGSDGRLGGTVLIAVELVAVGAAAAAGITIGAGVLVVGTVLVLWTAQMRADRAPGWLAAGALWVGLPCILLLWLAQHAGAGRTVLFWLFAVVWATDIGAYVFGRWFGGPHLAPKWSPGKTWAGLIGGAACAALAGLATAWVTGNMGGITAVASLVAVSAALAIVEQFGDLAESVAKRRFGVKDSSGLIPGHGGFLDRLDGLLAVIPAVALLTWAGGDRMLAWH